MIEQRHDEHGIAGWPQEIAPYDVHVVVLPGLEEQAEAVAAALEAAGASVLLDDRDLRAGREVRRRRPDRDAQLRVTVGKKTLEDGMVDVRDRATGDERRVPAQEVIV